MAKIHELLGLDESGKAVKTQNVPAQQAKNDGNGANPASGSSSSQKNEGVQNAKKVLTPGPFDGTNGVATKEHFAKAQAKTFDANRDAYTHYLDTAKGVSDLNRYDYRDNAVSIARNPQMEAQKKRLTYAEMVDRLYPEQAEARRKEDEARDAKKRRREAVITALGDGLTTIANLGSVIGGANPVSYETMSERSQARWDKIKADKDARRDAYRAARLRAAQADQEREDALAAAERTAKQRDEDNAREDAYRLLQLRNQRDIAGLRTDAQRDIAEGNWANRKEVANINQQGANWRSQHKPSSGSGSQKINTEIIDPVTGERHIVPVTGNKYLDYIISQYGKDNETHVTEDDGFGGTKTKTTNSSNGNKNAAADARRKWHEQRKQKSGQGGKTIPGTRQASKGHIGPA